ncbi:retrotransposon protein, putative, ty1-copia subclass [Tanacetum coccineum]
MSASMESLNVSTVVEETLKVGNLIGFDMKDASIHVRSIIEDLVHLRFPNEKESDRKGTQFDPITTYSFNKFIDDAKLQEVVMGVRNFTRINKKGTKLSKLVRFLISTKVLHTWPTIHSTALPHKFSDHCPIRMESNSADFDHVPFKFFNSWLNEESINMLVQSSWVDEPGCRHDVNLCRKLKALKAKLKPSMFEREKLSGNNFNDWFRQLKLVLRVEKKMYVIEQPIPPAPAADRQQMCWRNGMQYMMLIMRSLNPCLRNKLEWKERLGYVLSQDLSVGLILNGLTSDFASFVRNYNMHNMRKTIGELHALLIEYEKGLPKKVATPQVMTIQGGRIQKDNKKSQKAKGKGKGKGKGKDKSYIPKPKNPKPSAKEHPEKNDACHHCKEVGHWKRNCFVCLAKLMKNKKQVGTASSSGIFTIELFSFPNKSWVYETGCGTHICITKQGLRGARKLEQGALYLYMGNGVRAQVEAIGSF